MKNFTLKAFIILFCVSISTFAQNKQVTKNNTQDASQLILTEENQRNLNNTGYVRCLTTENELALKAKYPERASDDQFENWIGNKIEQVRQERIANPGARQQVVINIPVVVHVVHSGQAIGTAPNITDNQVISQIVAMNEDFRKLTGTPGDGTGIDVELEFCLAQTDPNGNPTNGIVRFDSSAIGTTWSGPGGTTDTVLKPATQWDPTQYMNMWSVQFSDGTLLGYAQFPDASGLPGLNASGGAANSDGVVAAYSTFGDIGSTDGTFLLNSPYDRGRTMTHEVGHYLGLRHIWGDANCGTDYCADTPVQQTSSGGNCPSTTTCDGVADLTTNYMDYSNDICMNNFTQNQKDRMLIVMANSPRRMELASSNACTASTTPVINFAPGSPSPGQVAEGSDCNFLDYTIDLTSTLGGSAASTVTLINSGTAVENEDFMLMNNSVTFPMGSTTPSNAVTLRVFNDNFVEADETILLALSITTTGDSTIASSTYNYTITNDDEAVTSTSTTTVFYDDFSDGDNVGWTLISDDIDTADDWTVVEEANWATPFGIYTDFFMVSYSWNGQSFEPDNYISSPLISIPVGGASANLRYFAGSGSDTTFYNESYEVYASTTIGSVANITAGTLLVDTVIPAQGGAYYDVDVSAFIGQDIYITFRHHDTINEWLLGIDEVEVTVDGATGIQTDVNTADQFNLLTAGLAYSVDAATSNIMADIDNTGGFDYGCTTVAVSRDLATAGAAAVSYGGGVVPAGFVTAKTFDITTTNTGTGAATVNFYFTDAELTAWEGITLDSRNNLYAKNDTTGEVVALTLTAFGTDFKLAGTFANGLAGTYYFGSQLAFLSTGDFELANSISIYPNPTVSILTIKVDNDNDLPNAYKVYNMLGQLITENTINSVQDLTIDATSFSNGMYFIKISKAGNAVTFPFIKK